MESRAQKWPEGKRRDCQIGRGRDHVRRFWGEAPALREHLVFSADSPDETAAGVEVAQTSLFSPDDDALENMPAGPAGR